jgi:putative sigma-54 modulation protein
MTTTIVGRNIKLTEPIKNLIHKRSDKLDKKYFKSNSDYRINVVLKVENRKHIADILVYKNKRVFKKTSSTEDMYKSINEAFDIVDRDIRKHRGKLRDKKTRLRQEEPDDLDDLFEKDGEDFDDN